MNTRFFAGLVALTALSLAVPAQAGNYCAQSGGGGCTGPSANDIYRAQRGGYNQYDSGPYFSGYNNGYYTPVPNSASVSCFLLFCATSHGPHRGEKQVNPDCSTSSWNGREWVPVSAPPPGGCPRGTFMDREGFMTR